jgi:hypothetical protein
MNYMAVVTQQTKLEDEIDFTSSQADRIKVKGADDDGVN